MTGATVTEQVSSIQLSQYAKLIYEVTGIKISPEKKALLSNRLRRRLKATGISTFSAYYNQLKKLPTTDSEWDAFLQEITTHETFLFRDEIHWEWFRNTYLKEISAEAVKGTRQRRLRIWSAACSTGDESYTAAACIVHGLTNYSQWDIKIIGTDIGVGAVEHALNPEFSKRAIRLTPPEIKRRCFVKDSDEEIWRPKPALTALTSFRQHNLLNPLRESSFDLVFLKNVLIYFDKNSKKVVVDNILKAMAPGSLLLAGAAEGVSDLLNDLERLQSWLYRKNG